MAAPPSRPARIRRDPGKLADPYRLTPGEAGAYATDDWLGPPVRLTSTAPRDPGNAAAELAARARVQAERLKLARKGSSAT